MSLLQAVFTLGIPAVFSVGSLLGAGAAFFACNGDGQMDRYVVNRAYLSPQPRNAFYRNRRNGCRGYGMGCSAGDCDNDGANVLYRNEGGRFTARTASRF